MPRKHPYVSRRSATPQFGCAKQRKQNPGAKTRRGNEGVLFDECHVETNTCRKGTGGATAPLLRAAHGRLRLWRRCSDTNCQRERSCCGDADRCGARIAPQSWQWLRHVLRGILEGQPHEVAVKAPTWHASPIASEESCAGRASRAGTLSNTSSFTTAVGGTSIKCRCRRRSIRSSNGWSPRRGCGTRVPRMSGPTCAAMRRFSRRNVRRCVV